ncbi:MAG: hypothetical protein M3328_17895, partial [Chloroflexota bacterium]|nr:hypothetical protein [Chloroflexota bacterium]
LGVSIITGIFAFQANEVNLRANSARVRMRPVEDTWLAEIHVVGCTFPGSQSSILTVSNPQSFVFTNDGGASVSLEEVKVDFVGESKRQDTLAVHLYDNVGEIRLPATIAANESRKWLVVTGQTWTLDQEMKQSVTKENMREKIEDWVDADAITWTLGLGNGQTLEQSRSTYFLLELPHVTSKNAAYEDAPYERQFFTQNCEEVWSDLQARWAESARR